jgi:glycerol kinase
MAADHVLALDQGTTSSRAIVFDRAGSVVAMAQREYPQGYPSPGHVTQDPEDIWQSQLGVAREALEASPGGRALVPGVAEGIQGVASAVAKRAGRYWCRVWRFMGLSLVR